MTRKLILFLLLTFLIHYVSAQKDLKLKFIPEVSVKFGSQSPAIGIQTCLSGGILFNDIWYAGIGSGYTSEMGLGGKTIPVFLNGRIFFSLNTLLNTAGWNISKDLPMMLFMKQGISINKNDPYRTGYAFSGGLAYRWDVIKINSKSVLPFWSGIEIEYNRTSYYDEYRGYAITDGYISQLYLLLNISIDIKAIQL